MFTLRDQVIHTIDHYNIAIMGRYVLGVLVVEESFFQEVFTVVMIVTFIHWVLLIDGCLCS